MNTIIELKSTNLTDVIKLMQAYSGNFPREFEFPNIVTVRLQNVSSRFGKVNADITFNANMQKKIMDIHYSPYGYAVKMERHATPFDMTVQLGNDFFDRVKFLKLPTDKTLLGWLLKNTDNDFRGTNAEFIVFMCHCGGTALGAFPFALDSTVSGNTITYTCKDNFYNIAKDGIEKLRKENFLEKRLEGWDCLNLTWEQFWKITETVCEDELNDTFSHLSMERLAVKLMEEKADDNRFEYGIYFYEADPRKMCLDITFTESEKLEYNSETYRLKFWHDFNPITGENKLRWDFADPSKIDEEIYERFTDNSATSTGWSTIDFLVYLFLYNNHFMLNYKDVATDVEEKICHNRSEGGKKHKHHGRSSVRMFKQYTLKKGWKTKVNRKKAEIHCLAWGVRGHFRHYKNGKVIFVNAYVKGKERDKYAGKDYILPPTEVI